MNIWETWRTGYQSHGLESIHFTHQNEELSAGGSFGSVLAGWKVTTIKKLDEKGEEKGCGRKSAKILDSITVGWSTLDKKDFHGRGKDKMCPGQKRRPKGDRKAIEGGWSQKYNYTNRRLLPGKIGSRFTVLGGVEKRNDQGQASSCYPPKNPNSRGKRNERWRKEKKGHPVKERVRRRRVLGEHEVFPPQGILSAETEGIGNISLHKRGGTNDQGEGGESKDAGSAAPLRYRS